MKLQHLTVIFIIIIIPILLVVSYYIGLQIDTINKQTAYDTKLQEATGEAISALEINTVEWNPKFSELQDSKRRDVTASINTFIKSISNKMGVAGTANEYTLNYIPAVVYTLYDGYYMYSNSNIPKVTIDDNGQVELGTDGEPIYAQNNATEYKHVLQSFTPYSETLTSGNDVVTLNYTLDNFVRVYGTINNKPADFEGYLTKKGEISLSEPYTVNFNGSDLSSGEELKEKIRYTLDGTNYAEPDVFSYVYDTNNTKYYYNNNQISDHSNEFFYLDANNMVVWTNQLSKEPLKKIIEIETDGAPTQAKKVEYYQSLKEKDDSGKFIIYTYNTTEDKFEIDTDRTSNNNTPQIDYSNRNYCIDSYIFTEWFNENVGANQWKSNIATEYDNNGNPTAYLQIEGGTFNITGNNEPDPEKEKDYLQSPFTIHKREVMKNSIETNLKRAVVDENKYLNGTNYEYRLPELSEEDWDKLLGNVSILGFLQGVPIGLKYYNNYAISSSSSNNEYVDPKGIYLTSSGDQYYHRRKCADIICDESNHETVVGYRNTDFIVKTVGDWSYFMHDDGAHSQLACYNCLVDSSGNNSDTTYEKEYYTALARERYISQKHITPNISVPIDGGELNYKYEIVYMDSDSGDIIYTSSVNTTHNDTITIDISVIPSVYGTEYTIVPDQTSVTVHLDQDTIKDIIFYYKKTPHIVEDLTLTVVSICDGDDTVDGDITEAEKGFKITVSGGIGECTYYRDGEEITLSDDNKDFTRFGEHKYSVKDSTGTQKDSDTVYDWTISEQADFEILRNNYVNNGNSEKLTAKIDVIADGFNVSLENNLIGNSEEQAFNKILEGNNHTINVSGKGLFGYNKGTIQNLTVNADIHVNTTENVGGVAAHNKGTIKKVTVTGIIENSTVNKVDTEVTINNTGTGGICGFNGDPDENSTNIATITKCKNEAIIICKSNGGGIAGINIGGTIDTCINNGNIEHGEGNTDYNRIGGIAGVQGGIGRIDWAESTWESIINHHITIKDAKMGTISNCVNTGNITGIYRNLSISEQVHVKRYGSYYGVGGIVGICDDIPIMSTIEDSSKRFVEAIRNMQEGIDDWRLNIDIGMWKINYCASSGQIKGGIIRYQDLYNNRAIGGILGFNFTNAEMYKKEDLQPINNCIYTEGTVQFCSKKLRLFTDDLIFDENDKEVSNTILNKNNRRSS